MTKTANTAIPDVTQKPETAGKSRKEPTTKARKSVVEVSRIETPTRSNACESRCVSPAAATRTCAVCLLLRALGDCNEDAVAALRRTEVRRLAVEGVNEDEHVVDADAHDDEDGLRQAGPPTVSDIRTRRHIADSLARPLPGDTHATGWQLFSGGGAGQRAAPPRRQSWP